MTKRINRNAPTYRGVSTIEYLSVVRIRLRMRRQIKRNHNLYTNISTHIEYARLNACRHIWVVKIFQSTHVRLIVLVGQVGSFHKYFQNRITCWVDDIPAKTCTDQVIACCISFSSVSSKKAVLRAIVIKTYKSVNVSEWPEPFGKCSAQLRVGMQRWNKWQIFQLMTLSACAV